MDPEKFTAALPKAQRKGRIFVDYLRNQRGATAVMPYSARAREGAPVAAPITWKEMETIDKPSHFHITDAKALLKRAGSKVLQDWGRASQELRSEEHTSELQSIMRLSYAVFCLKKKKKQSPQTLTIELHTT